MKKAPGLPAPSNAFAESDWSSPPDFGGVIILIAAARLEAEMCLFLSCVTGRVTGARASGTSGVFVPS